MSSIPTYSSDGKKSGTIKVPKILEETKINHDLVHQVAIGLQANLRRPIAYTKTRGEVSGGGRKPWRQKGTGRARAGSSRSPLWRGGGVTHGPQGSRHFGVRLPMAMKRMAFRQIISAKIQDKEVFVVTAIKLAKPKTSLMESFLRRLPLKEGRIVMVVDETDQGLIRATGNLPYLKLRTMQNVDILDLLTCDSVILTKNAFQALESRYG